MPRPTLYVVDGSSYIYRAFYAIRNLSTASGLPTNAVFGFATMLLKLVRDRRPSHLCVALDPPGPSFRKEIFAEYKAQRPPAPDDLVPQFALVRELISAFRIPMLEVPGFEADDVIGTLAHRARADGFDVVIVASDKDLMQLVDDHIRLLDTMKDREFGPAEVEERYGVRPGQIADLLGLSGDTSDNIPGVPGIGDKTAAQLLGEYGSIENLLEHVDEVSGTKRKQNLRDFADQARLSRKLALLRTDVPLDTQIAALAVQEPDHDQLTELLNRLEFSTLLKELKLEQASSENQLDRKAYRTILTEEELAEVARRCREAGRCAIAVETVGATPSVTLIGVALCWAPGQACYVPLDHRYMGAPPQLTIKQLVATVGPLFADPTVSKLGHDLKATFLAFRGVGVDLAPLGLDVMVSAYLLDPAKPSYRLEELAREYVNIQMSSRLEVLGKGKHQLAFDELDLDRATTCAAEAADVVLRLEAPLASRIEEADLKWLLTELELPLVRVLALMEECGVKVDPAILGELSRRFSEIARKAEQNIFELSGTEFNINSPKQLQEILFGRLGLKPTKKTKSGYSTDVAVLEQLSREHPLPKEILEYRSVTKLKSTYVDALPQLISPRSGRIHTSYNQAVAATGRLSSSDPNLQNIPVRTELGREIRRAFVAAPDHVLLSADYSQIELRILAHVSDDATLLDAFHRGEDIHTRTAAEVFGVPRDQVTPELRTNAKAINFGIVYGMGAFRLSRELGISNKQAQAYIDSYFGRLPGVKSFIEQTMAEAHRDGFVRTIFGRRRFLPDLASRDHNLKSAAERVAVNTPIQGSAADLIKLAMVRIQRALEEQAFRARMILQVHDELVFEVPDDEVDRLATLVREKMERAAELRVPLKLDLRTALNWAEAH